MPLSTCRNVLILQQNRSSSSLLQSRCSSRLRCRRRRVALCPCFLLSSSDLRSLKMPSLPALMKLKVASHILSYFVRAPVFRDLEVTNNKGGKVDLLVKQLRKGIWPRLRLLVIPDALATKALQATVQERGILLEIAGFDADDDPNSSLSRLSSSPESRPGVPTRSASRPSSSQSVETFHFDGKETTRWHPYRPFITTVHFLLATSRQPLSL